MSQWKPKRFWQQATVVADDGGWQVELDGRRVKTPAKRALRLPTREMAEAIAVEWQAQEMIILPQTMPITRAANAALDKVAPQHEEVAEMIASYGATDLLCYRAVGPTDLVQRQRDSWQPLLDWTTERYGARLVVTEGVIPVPQPQAALDVLTAAVSEMGIFSLTALHDLVALSGSLILGLATTEARLTPDEAWRLSRLDEDWQIAQWGADEDAEAMAARKKLAFLGAAMFYSLAQGN